MKFFLVLVFFAHSSFGRTIVVADSLKARSITRGIQLAKAGDTLLVTPGLYREGRIIVNKSVVIIGLNFPVLDGEGEHQIITVTSDHVTIRGFRFINTGSSSLEDIAAIKGLEVKNVRVLNNQFENSSFGIYFASSSDCWIVGNSLKGERIAESEIANGIHLWKCDRATITDNEVSGHRDGIYFEFVTQSKVIHNISRENVRYGLHFMFSHDDVYESNSFRNNGSGVAVMYSKNVNMTGNFFENNRGPACYGLLLKDITRSTIEYNLFSDNSIAMYLEGCSYNNLSSNTFSGNGWALRIQASCDSNTLTLNGFYRNSFDLATNGSISLNRIHHNYWDKYEGYDLNKDGIGDVPFRPVSLYGMVVEKMPIAVVLWRSMLIQLLDRTEKALPAVTPVNLVDETPQMKFSLKR